MLEIGCGWGSFALMAAGEYGARVTGVTLSQQQLELARERVAAADLADRVEIRLQDYRTLEGQFSKIASIEMLEAIGYAQYPTFFAACDRLLAPGGLAAIQVIGMPDQRFERYRRKEDWIQRYIFPGSLLPSLEALQTAMSRASSLMVVGLEEIGPHYADTLKVWRERFFASLPAGARARLRRPLHPDLGLLPRLLRGAVQDARDPRHAARPRPAVRAARVAGIAARAGGERIAQDERLTPATNDRNRWLGLVALTIGVAMIIVDATIVNVAIPSIIRDLHIGITQAEWANSIYSLVFAALLISVGRIGDVTGRRRVFIWGLLVFLGASLITALAPSGTVLLAGRFLQGVGGALILPSTLSIVNATFRGRERAIAFGIWGSVIGGMAALGPLAGGWFVTNLSWRWAFYVNLPIGALALAGALLFVGESRDPDARPGFDPPGVVLSTVGFLGVVFGLIEGQTYGWWTAKRDFLGLSPGGLSVIPFAFAVGVLSLAGFVLVERRRALAGRPVLVDFSLFRIPTFRYGNVAVLIVGLGELGLVFVIPLFLQSVLGLSAFDTGLVLTALAGGAFLAGGLAAPLTRRIGPHRVVQLGLAIEVVGIVAVGLTFSADRPAWQFCPQLFVYGIGVGFATAQLTSLILATCRAPSPERDRGSRARRDRSAPRSGSRSSAPRSRPGSPPAPASASRQSPRSRLRSARRSRPPSSGAAARCCPPSAARRNSSLRSHRSRRRSSRAHDEPPSSPPRSSWSGSPPPSGSGPAGKMSPSRSQPRFRAADLTVTERANRAQTEARPRTSARATSRRRILSTP